MISYASLPAINAGLNLTSALLLTTGYGLITRKQVAAHRVCMVSAFLTSSLFLISYIAYHLKVGAVHYQGQGLRRMVYFGILTSHTVLAILIVPLVLRTLYLAVSGRYETHRRWARWTLPLWFYVSVTGVVIYEMLY